MPSKRRLPFAPPSDDGGAAAQAPMTVEGLEQLWVARLRNDVLAYVSAQLPNHTTGPDDVLQKTWIRLEQRSEAIPLRTPSWSGGASRTA
ncbi:hypothetical protein GCM10009530_60290 [Microbispora corallina]|uniref:RNA polymerase sigma-70 region 2 domain-containing protein n=1 Tax=Microbispora corallina TaxID=83302 RepID=A0ABQ4FYX0_9ACTN|nr:hypothetical protein Mco01_30150 [Microbispora corallina]